MNAKNAFLIGLMFGLTTFNAFQNAGAAEAGNCGRETLVLGQETENIEIALKHTQSAYLGCVPADKNDYFDRTKTASNATRADWNPQHFTDPAHHNPKHFRYIVHMIMMSKYSPESTFDFISHDVANNPCSTISTSVIDEKRTGTYGDFGFILSVPAENVLLADSGDIGTDSLISNRDSSRFNKILKIYAKLIGPLKSPEKIMQDPSNKIYSASIYNEVLVEGKFERGVKVVGIIIKANYSHGSGTQEMIDLAKRKGLPVVFVGDPNE